MRPSYAAVLQPSSTCQWFRWLTVCCQRFTHQPIVFCVVRPTRISLGLAMQAVSLFSSQVAALVSRVSRHRRSTLARACTPLTKSEEKREAACSLKNRSDLEISRTNLALASSNSRIRAKTYLLCVPNLVPKRSTLIHF